MNQVQAMADRIDTTNRLAEQNDQFRAAIIKGGHAVYRGRCVMTPGVAAHGPESFIIAPLVVANDKTFTEDNDPYGDHSFGVVSVCGVKMFWKIDIFEDESMTYGSAYPDDPDRSFRVLTIYLPSEH